MLVKINRNIEIENTWMEHLYFQTPVFLFLSDLELKYFYIFIYIYLSVFVYSSFFDICLYIKQWLSIIETPLLLS